MSKKHYFEKLSRLFCRKIDSLQNGQGQFSNIYSSLIVKDDFHKEPVFVVCGKVIRPFVRPSSFQFGD